MWILLALIDGRQKTSQQILNYYKGRYHKRRTQERGKHISLQSQNIYSNIEPLIEEGCVVVTTRTDERTQKETHYYSLAGDGCYGGKLMFQLKDSGYLFQPCGNFDICKCPENDGRREITKECIHYKLYMRLKPMIVPLEIKFVKE